ncbi:MAG TPA: NnrS family protein [Burkholderiales bacterium]|nr:NnrS family protein [Burkholderiales bacterium]
MVKPLDLPEPNSNRSPANTFALWRVGFRPFYLLASCFASLSIALWGAQYAGFLSTPYLRGSIWHAHEMVFGFTLAVMTGFLFTAVRNWTSRSTPTGVWLAALAALWLAGRVLVLTPYAIAAAAINVLFPIAVAIGIGIALVGSRNRHNLFFVVLLVVMAAAELATHLAQFGLAALPEWLGIQVALDVILLVMTVLGGRVIPMFTTNGLPGAQVGRNRLVERLVPVAMLALLFADVLSSPAWLLAIVTATGAVAQGARVMLWRPWQTLRVPLVWILHVGYVWIPVHLALRALSQFGLVPPPLATHAMTVGAIGALTLGMMTRTAKGHTGRPLVADRYEVVAFALVTAAAITRVLVPLVAIEAYGNAVTASAIMWSAAFAIYAVRYWPILTRPRVGGAPG